MAALWFLLSVVVVLLALRRQAIPLLSTYGIFLAFQCLYNLIPWVSVEALGLDADAINQQVLLSSTANIAFAVAIRFFYRKYDLPQQHLPPKEKSREYVLTCFPLFFITAILCYFWGWHVFAQSVSQSAIALAGGGMMSVAAWAKHACVASYLYYIGRFRLDRYSMILLAGLLVVATIDGSRTDIFPILVLTLMVWQSVKKVSTSRILAVFVVCISALMALRGFLIGATGLDAVVGPLVVEGSMGSYSSVQSIYAVQHMTSPPYLYGVGSMETWVQGISGTIIGDFAPLGGVYYVAQAVANFGYFGPVIETFCFGWLLAISEKWKQRKVLLYSAFTSTVGILFVKTEISNSVKLLISLLFFLAMFDFLHRLRVMLRHPPVKQSIAPLVSG
jgi:hypothetical protein